MANVTIKDIAREAGVSISTVSNALNGVNVLKPETREHILEVADRLHYIPNLNGKNLKAKSTKVIGLFVTSLKGPYFATLADIMVWECQKYGYELNIFVTWDGKSAISSILGKSIDGCVILSGDVDERAVKQMERLEVPAIFLDREEKSKKISSVIFDSYKDGEMVAEFLIRRNIKRIAYLEGIVHNYDAIERAKGFKERLAKEGIELDPEYILKGEFEKEVSHKSVKEFLEKGLPLPEVFFAANDLSAFGCMEALREAGYKVPKDTMVIGVDDVEFCEWHRPTLTTIKTGYEKQAVVAIRKLVKMINGEETGDITKLHGRLIERKSTAIVEK